jgi:hypothetical protein
MQTLQKTKAKSIARVKTVKVVLIDPFQGGLFPLVVDPSDLVHLHKLLDCDLMQSLALSQYILLWFDECAAQREPFYPRFTIGDADGNLYVIPGYGLLTGQIDAQKRITGCATLHNSLKVLGEIISFEPWTERLDPYLYLEQLFRSYP